MSGPLHGYRIVDLSQIVSGPMATLLLSDQGADINREALDANELLMGAVDLFRERAEEKQVELITHVHTNLPARMEGDLWTWPTMISTGTPSGPENKHSSLTVVPIWCFTG